MDKFVETQTFAAVVDSGSFVKAADAPSTSKAAVSRYVGDLETRLSVRLLHRTTRRLSLTEDGQVFHARCKELLSGINEAEAEVSVRSGEATGHLKVNVPVTFGLMYLAPLWAEFMALHPKGTLDVTLTDRVVDLVEDGYDLAVRIALLPSSSLVSRQLTSTRLMLCATPAYLQMHGTPEHPSDLAQHSIIAYSLMARRATSSVTSSTRPLMSWSPTRRCRSTSTAEHICPSCWHPVYSIPRSRSRGGRVTRCACRRCPLGPSAGPSCHLVRSNVVRGNPG